MKPQLALTPLVLVSTLVLIIWVNILFLGDSLLVSPLWHGGPLSSMHFAIFIRFEFLPFYMAGHFVELQFAPLVGD